MEKRTAERLSSVRTAFATLLKQSNELLSKYHGELTVLFQETLEASAGKLLDFATTAELAGEDDGSGSSLVDRVIHRSSPFEHELYEALVGRFLDIFAMVCDLPSALGLVGDRC